MSNVTFQRRHRTFFQFDGQKTLRIDRARHGKLTLGNFFKAERSIVRGIANQNDRAGASFARSLDGDGYKLAAYTYALEGGPHRKRAEQERLRAEVSTPPKNK